MSTRSLRGSGASGGTQTAASTRVSRTSTRRQQPSFLYKTMEMLEDVPDDVMCWAPDGRSFVIHKPQVLAEMYIPRYFSHSKFASFVRQLNFYGFRKIKSDFATETDWEFVHENFMRGRADLLHTIKRRTYNDGKDSTADVDDLRKEVSQLKSSLAEMRQEMARLTALVTAQQSTAGASATPPAPSVYEPAAFVPNKKRKAVPSTPEDDMELVSETEELHSMLSGMGMDDVNVSMPPPALTPRTLDKVWMSWEDMDGDLDMNLLPGTGFRESDAAPQPLAPPTQQLTQVEGATPAETDPALAALVMQLLPGVLKSLPQAMVSDPNASFMAQPSPSVPTWVA